MRRPAPVSAEAAGQDSFLDIVCNMVGILIILVMVVGVRAGTASIQSPTASIDRAAKAPLAEVQQQAASLESEILELAGQRKRVQRDIHLRRIQQEKLATLIGAIEQELESQRAKLSTGSQQQYDLRRSLADAEAELEQLQREYIALDVAQPSTIEVQSLPTPISKTVHGRELHFQLVNHRITIIPLDELLAKFKSDAPNKIWKLKNQALVTDTVGPIDGFRLRYQLEQTGPIVRLVKWELLPVSDDLGEPIDEALAEGSRLRSLLDSIDRSNTTLTVWTYPDSFAPFRTLKAELHSLGYATAGRPLPADQPIGGSPEGSRSAAQ